MRDFVKTGGVIDRLVCVLSYSKWQTASLIACQVTFPPDALARVYKQLTRHNRACNPATEFVRKSLGKMHNKGDVERRLTSDGIFEYRLKQWTAKGKPYLQTIKHDAYHKGYVRKSDFADGKNFTRVAEDLVSRGILVAESDGNFTLNPNLQTEQKRNECN